MKRILYVVLFVTTLFSCVSSENDSKPVLAVTIEPYRFVVEAIAGDVWKVMTVVPKGNSPETFDPSLGKMMKLDKCKAYFLAGDLGFEKAWYDRMSDNFPKLRLIDTSVGIERIDEDPHLWTSPDNMLIIASNICDALCDIDSVNAEDYRSRLFATEKIIHATDSLIRTRISENNIDKNFLIFHPALTYFANLYGLNQIVLEEHGKEPSALHLKQIVDDARRLGVNKIFVQAEFDKKHSETISREIGAEIYRINPLSFDWVGEMLHVVDCLKNGK